MAEGTPQHCWAIIPVKPLDEAKMRLAGVLSPEARGRLVRAMLGHVVGAARAAERVDTIAILGHARHGQDEALALLADPGGGLNQALQAALVAAVAAGATRLVILPADLPQLTTQDVGLLACAADRAIAIAPDRHGSGTNALSLPLPAARDFAFAFGPDSCARHHAEALRLGLAIEEIHSPGLARDIDLPADLPDAAKLLGDAQ